MLVAIYYMVVGEHTLKEWIAFSTDHRRIGKGIKHLVIPPREWDRSWDRLKEEWRRYAANSSVLSAGPPGSWDEAMATFASVIKDDSNLKMYYSGRRDNWIAGQIGLATSEDGENWIKFPGNPILKLGPLGSWDDTRIWCPMVWKEEVYHMIYSALDSKGIIQVGYASSADGIHWTKSVGNPVFNDPTWAHDHTEGWGVIKVEETYLLWYNTLGGGVDREVGVAVSRDLINWMPHSDSPVFASAHETDRHHQFCVFPFRYRDFYYLIVPSQGGSKNYTAFYLYRCKNPYFSEKDRECLKRILLPGRTGEWDACDLDTPFLITHSVARTTFYKNQFWLYYSGEGGKDRWKEGLVREPNIEQCLQVPR